MFDNSISKDHYKFKIVSMYMTFAIKRSYNKNMYVEYFRKDRRITSFEEDAFQLFFNSINRVNPEILDLGCGTGVPYGKYMIEKGCELTGIDYCSKHINIAKKNIPTANLIEANMLKFDYKKLYDGIVILYSLFHIHKMYHKKFLERISLSLNDGGAILINIRKKSTDNYKYKSDFCAEPMYWSNYSEQEFIRIAKDIGFNIINIGNERDYGSKEDMQWLLLKKDKYNY